MNRIVSREFVKRTTPLLVALGLGVTACADDTKKQTIEQQTIVLHDKAVDICTDEANEKFAEKYPAITVSSNPSVKELQDALANAQGRETQGPIDLQTDFDSCMDREFNTPLQQLIDQQINVAPTTGPADTTADTLEG